MSQAIERPYRPRHAAPARVRPYLADRPARHRRPAPPAATEVPQAVLERVAAGLRALPAVPEATCTGATGTEVTSTEPPRRSAARRLGAELAALARPSLDTHPHLWRPPEANEPSPDTVTTRPLAVVGS